MPKDARRGGTAVLAKVPRADGGPAGGQTHEAVPGALLVHACAFFSPVGERKEDTCTHRNAQTHMHEYTKNTNTHKHTHQCTNRRASARRQTHTRSHEHTRMHNEHGHVRTHKHAQRHQHAIILPGPPSWRRMLSSATGWCDVLGDLAGLPRMV